MSLFVSLYWDGKIIQIPGLGLAYDPPRAKGCIMLNEKISYYRLVSMICDAMKIDMNAHIIDITWRRFVNYGGGCIFIGQAVDEVCLEYMFSESVNSGQIELIVEYSSTLQIQHISNYDVGTSTRLGTSMENEHLNYEFGGMSNVEVENNVVGEQENVPNVIENMVGEQLDVAIVDSDSGSSTDSCGSDFEDREDVRNGSSGDEDLDYIGSSSEESSDDEIIDLDENYVPACRGEQPLPTYVQTGLPLFRSLPCEDGGYKPFYNEETEDNTCFWDDRNPTHIGLGTKFDSKLHLKTAISLWHVQTQRQFSVVESKAKRWRAICRLQKELQEEGQSNVAMVCNWQIRATLRKHDEKWEIKTWVNRHNCLGNRNSRGHENLSSAMIALAIRHQIEIDPDYKPAAVRKLVEESFHVQCSYKKAWYARRRAIELVYGG